MKIKTTDNFTILEDERDDIVKFTSYLEYKVPTSFEDKNIIVNLLKYDAFGLSQLLLFLKLSAYHRASKHSFVLVNDAIDIDDIPGELVVVPTLQEAEDIVEMEEIERDLGF